MLKVLSVSKVNKMDPFMSVRASVKLEFNSDHSWKILSSFRRAKSAAAQLDLLVARSILSRI